MREDSLPLGGRVVTQIEQYKTVRLACVWLYLIVIAPCYNISVTLGSLPYCDRASRVPVNTKEFYYE